METNRAKYYSDLSTKHAAWLKSFPSVVIENGHVRRWQEKLLPGGNPRDWGEVLQDFRGHREGKGGNRGVFCLHGSNVRSDQLFESENVKRRYAYKLVQRSPALIIMVITGPVPHRRPPPTASGGLRVTPHETRYDHTSMKCAMTLAATYDSCSQWWDQCYTYRSFNNHEKDLSKEFNSVFFHVITRQQRC